MQSSDQGLYPITLVSAPQGHQGLNRPYEDPERAADMNKPSTNASVIPPIHAIRERPLREELGSARRMIRSGLGVAREREEALEHGVTRALADAVRPRRAGPVAEPALVLVPCQPVREPRLVGGPALTV